MPQSGTEAVPVGSSTVDGATRVGGASHAPADTGVVGMLTDLDDLPVAEHVARFEALHDVLQARLAGAPVDGGTA